MRGTVAFLAFAAVSAAAPLAAQAPAAPQEASIPFVAHDGIRDWKVDGSTTLFIQARDGKWYRATLFDTCRALNSAIRIGFDTGAYDRFDRTSAIIAAGQRCPVRSVVESGPPPNTAR